jgi:hypothetical protein
MRVRLASSILSLLSALLALPVLATDTSCAGQTLSLSTPAAQTTLVVVADRPIQKDLWPTLIVALREELNSDSVQVRALLIASTRLPTQSVMDRVAVEEMILQIRIVQGEEIRVGDLIGDKSITIVLHGVCSITPRPRPVVVDDTLTLAIGDLGWVRKSHAEIAPFAHVECGNLSRMLATQAFGLDHDGRNLLMARAIARVIMHEWIHIATQSAHHSADGVAKAQFSAGDLMAQSGKSVANARK